MFITASNILMASNHAYQERYTREENLTVWRGYRRPIQDSVSLDGNGAAPSQEIKVFVPGDQAQCAAEETNLEKLKDRMEKSNSKLFIIKLLLEKVTGKKIRVLTIEDLETDLAEKPAKLESENQQQGPERRGAGWGVIYNLHESYYQYEKMFFTAKGIIRTKDGKEISFSLQLNMSREFISEENFSLRAGDAVKVDPLIINFDGQAADLTNVKFTFDLNANGTEEEIPFVRPGTGFLALDADGDGKISDGSELFGPTTGDGFAEFAVYDTDKNNWIDEADPVFNKLLIWSKDAEGNDLLFSLREKDIGAIYLGHLNSLFSLADQANKLTGLIDSSGIYLKENGGAGIIQEVDIVA